MLDFFRGWVLIQVLLLGPEGQMGAESRVGGKLADVEGKTGCPTGDLDWWPFKPQGHAPPDAHFERNCSACHTAHQL